MSKLSEEIMGKLAAKKGGGEPADDEESDVTGEGEGDEEGYASDEEAAMQDFMDATDAAGKAAALKTFLEICVPKIVQG
jgi:hypothetical protein